MTKTKAKDAYSSKPPQITPAPEEDDEDAEDDDMPGERELGSRFMPFGTVRNKRKRGPRAAVRFAQKDSMRSQCDDGCSESALDTSSSQRSDEDEDGIADSAQERSDGHHHGSVLAMDVPRRGSVRMKVKPSKFREETSCRNNIPEANLPSKKRISGNFVEHTESKRHMPGTQNHLTEELKAALTVVKKIMKMEAAEPFNVPVDPIALGIPDYFDIVKRPMDLGTICKTLEIGDKYRNSQDVYEDIQLVWTNCRIYNHKGDPILELLARVKKNFMKYWTAAGLYTEKSSATFRLQNRSPDAVQSEIVVPSTSQKNSFDEQIRETGGTIKEAVTPDDSTVKHSGATEIKATKRPSAEFLNGLLGEQEAAFNLLNGDLDAFLLNPEGSNIISVYKSQKKKKVEQQDAMKVQPIQTPTLQAHLQENEKSPINSVKHFKNADTEHYRIDVDSMKDNEFVDSEKGKNDSNFGKSMMDADSIGVLEKKKKDADSEDDIKKDVDSFMTSEKNKKAIEPPITLVKKKKKKKKKDADSQENIKKDVLAATTNKKDPDSYITLGKNENDADVSPGKNAEGTDPSVTLENKDIDPHGTPNKQKKDADSGKPRRVSGTGHHKADCSCVVCTGVRRKLAREGKLGTLVIKIGEDVANSPNTHERLVVRLKTESISDGSKPSHRMSGGQRTKERKDERWAEESTLLNDKEEPQEKTKTSDDIIDATDQFEAGIDSAKADDSAVVGLENKDGAIEESAVMEQAKEFSAGDMKDCIEEDPKAMLMEDAEDVIQNEEQFADTEAYRQEGGVRYYRASYEMPLRKINPAILEMGQRLFGKGSHWNNGRSLGNHSLKGYSGSSVVSTVSMLLRGA